MALNEEIMSLSFHDGSKAQHLPEILKELDQDHILPSLLQDLRRLVCESGIGDHFRTDDEFLAMFLRVKKYNLEKAWQGVQYFYRVLKENRDLVEELRPSQLAYIYDFNILMFMKERCRTGGTVAVILARNWDPTVCTIYQVAQAYIFAYAECVMHEPDAKLTQLIGVTLIVDLKDIPFTYLRYLLPRHIKLIIMLARGGIPRKVVGIHFTNFPSFFSRTYQMVRRLLPHKIRKRIHFHQSPESLNKYFHLEQLPQSVGGGLDDMDTRNSQIQQTVLQEDTGLERYYGDMW